MPTDNPKISAYVPQAVYDRFKQFEKEQGISMSQAVIVIFAEYFGLEETIKESTKGTTVGGVTLTRIEKLEEELNSLKETTKLNSELLSSLQSRLQENIHTKTEVDNEDIIDEPLDNNASSPQLELLSDLPQEIKPIIAKTLSSLRFKLAKDTVSGFKSKHSTEEFTKWSKEHDPDGIAWKYVESPIKGYLPDGELSSEQKSRLLEWIEENIG